MPLKIYTDPTKEIKVIVASRRSKRPHVHGGTKACPFDPGNESMTPPSTLEIITFQKPREKWKVRAMENRFPALSINEKYHKSKAKTGAFGMHEVIIETPNHGELFENLSVEQSELVFSAYVDRFNAISKLKGVEYVFLFKNYGKGGGASIAHEHSQIMGLPFVPEMITQEFGNSKKNHCVYCSLARKNIVFQNKEFSVVVPPFGRFAFECWVIPKRHVSDFNGFNAETRRLFMKTLQEAIKRVKRKTDNYNVAFHNSCRKGNVHFHVEIYPRGETLAGLEFGTGVFINTTDDKTALSELR